MWSDSIELNAVPNKWVFTPVIDSDIIKINHFISRLNNSFFTGTIAQAEIDENQQLILYDLRTIQADYDVKVFHFIKPACFTKRRIAFKANSYNLLAAGQVWNWSLVFESFSDSFLWMPPASSTALWLDASDSSLVFKSADFVYRWVDKSIFGKDFTQSSNVSMPLTVSNALNNKPVISFDGINDYLRMASTPNYGNNISLFFVVQYADASRTSLFDSAPGNQNTLRNYSYVNRSIYNSFEWWDRSPSLTIDCAINEFEIINFVYELTSSGRSISKYINGSNYTTASSANTNGAAWNNFTIGSINTNESFFKGSIAEIIAFTSISTTDRQKVEGYLAWKWGLNLKLASSHPYKNKAPQDSA